MFLNIYHEKKIREWKTGREVLIRSTSALWHRIILVYFSISIFKYDILTSYFILYRLVWLQATKESWVKIIEKLRGNMVIYIYPGAHKFSLSISHLSWGSQTLLSHHYPYFPSYSFHF